MVEEEAPVIIKRWTGRQVDSEALEMRRRIKTPVELSRRGAPAKTEDPTPCKRRGHMRRKTERTWTRK